MNDAVYKFRRYEDSSLSYTGLDMHGNQVVGGFDTVIPKDEYKRLFGLQQTFVEVKTSKFNRILTKF